MTIGTVAQVVKAVGAIDYLSDYRFEEITAVSFDARNIQPGGLFIPLKGSTDGHAYIQQAIDNGAVATFWAIEGSAPDGICTIWVENVLEAFQRLAKWYLQKVNPKVIGITGSSGKTTTKDMTAAVVSSCYRVHKTQGNFNNEIGLPMTILQMPKDTEVLVLEMGMSEFGEIELLTTLATPDVAIITMIGESHMEQLGSREGIATAKLEILKGLKEGGTFIYSANEPLLSNWGQKEHPQELISKTFGTDERSTLYSLDETMGMDYCTFHTSAYPEQEVFIPVLGTYNIQNALAALLAAQALDIPYPQAIEALAGFQLTKNRTQWIDGIHGSRLLNDAYNASPAAMKAVLRAFSKIDRLEEGRRIAVLGDIRELGEQSAVLHASVSEAISPEEIDEMWLYGEEMHALYQAVYEQFGERVQYVRESKKELMDQLQQHLRTNDMVLIKSSNGTGLLEVVDYLTKR